MKTGRFLTVAACALISVSLVTPCVAKPRKKATPPPVHETVISSVSGNTVTITDEKTAKTVTVTPFTEVIINGQKSTLNDLKPGMVVSLTLSSATQASRITATSK